MTETLTFVPGTMCDRRVWGPVAALCQGFDIAHLPLEAARTWDGMRRLFDEAGSGPERLNLVGHSMGGYFALDYALRRPDRVRSLVVVCTSAAGLKEGEKAQRRKALDYLSRHPYTGTPPDRIRQFTHPSHHDDKTLLELMQAMDRDLGGEVLIAQFRETMERPDLEVRLPELAVPTLFVGSDHDPYATPDDIARMQRLAPGSCAVIAKDAGHLVLLEQPGWLAEQITTFQNSPG